MPNVNLEDIDLLYALMEEISILTYLQDVINFDIDYGNVHAKELHNAHMYTTSYLLNRQIKTVSQIWELLTKEDFGI